MRSPFQSHTMARSYCSQERAPLVHWDDLSPAHQALRQQRSPATDEGRYADTGAGGAGRAGGSVRGGLEGAAGGSCPGACPPPVLQRRDGALADEDCRLFAVGDHFGDHRCGPGPANDFLPHVPLRHHGEEEGPGADPPRQRWEVCAQQLSVQSLYPPPGAGAVLSRHEHTPFSRGFVGTAICVVRTAQSHECEPVARGKTRRGPLHGARAVRGPALEATHVRLDPNHRAVTCVSRLLTRPEAGRDKLGTESPRRGAPPRRGVQPLRQRKRGWGVCSGAGLWGCGAVGLWGCVAAWLWGCGCEAVGLWDCGAVALSSAALGYGVQALLDLMRLGTAADGAVADMPPPEWPRTSSSLSEHGGLVFLSVAGTGAARA